MQCEECRAGLRTLRTGHDAFAEYGESVLIPRAGAPPKAWRDFVPLLERISTENPPAARGPARMSSDSLNSPPRGR